MNIDINFRTQRYTGEKVKIHKNNKYTFPLLDNCNDYIELYIKQEGQKIIIEDDFSLGLYLMDYFDDVYDIDNFLKKHGLKSDNGFIRITINSKSYERKINNILKNICSVYDCFGRCIMY